MVYDSRRISPGCAGLCICAGALIAIDLSLQYSVNIITALVLSVATNLVGFGVARPA
jgi:hypothetical protein